MDIIEKITIQAILPFKNSQRAIDSSILRYDSVQSNQKMIQDHQLISDEVNKQTSYDLLSVVDITI